MGEEDDNAELTLRGVGVSPGVVVGPVFLMLPEEVTIVERRIGGDEPEREIVRLEDALIETRRQIRRIKTDLEARTGMAHANIFDAHLMVLDDRAFIGDIITEIREKRRNVEASVKTVADHYAQVLSSMEDDYLRERVADVRDVARRILRNLGGDLDTSITSLTEKHIVVAVDLAPSDTAVLRRDVVSGFATDLGSPTSHTAVMARALEIPAVVALRDISKRVSAGDPILIDGNRGVLIIRPTREHLEEYGKVAEARKTITQGLSNLVDKPAETTDGHRITVSANAEGVEELDSVLHYGAQGIGLFRSEYLYLASDKPVGEDDQAKIYGEVAARLAPAPVIIRTLDIGGDKFFRNVGKPREANPFLGCRSIRLSLLYPDEFKCQLRAILRASVAGNVKIMYPMISSVGELLKANELLEESKRELAAAGVPFDQSIEVGIMIEVPSAALMADVLAEHAAFFSLGTNDLVQYTMAVDRVNERVAYLYEPTHPAVLRLIRETVDAAHRHNRWVGLCGEMGGDPVLSPLLIGMDLDELSMAPAAIPGVKDAIRSVSYERAKSLAAVALRCRTAAEVLEHCRRLIKEVAPELLELI